MSVFFHQFSILPSFFLHNTQLVLNIQYGCPFSGTENRLITQHTMQNWTKGHIFTDWLGGQLKWDLQNQTTVFHIKWPQFPSILERKKLFISVSNGLICRVFLCCRQFFLFEARENPSWFPHTCLSKKANISDPALIVWLPSNSRSREKPWGAFSRASAYQNSWD